MQTQKEWDRLHGSQYDAEEKAQAEHAAKMARIESIKAGNRKMMAGRCYECGARVETGNFIESGNQRYCFPCAAKGADS